MEKKEISARTTVKAIITGFVSYGIIVIFISLIIFTIGNYFFEQLSNSTSRGLYITVPLMAVIFLYFIIHGICRISTYDVFKKCNTNPNNYRTIIKALNTFFIICIILSIVIFLSLLYLNLEFQVKSMELATLKYKEVFSENYVKILTSQMNEIFNNSKINLTISTTILVLGIAISILSLIPYQRKMILKYNEFKDDSKNN